MGPLVFGASVHFHGIVAVVIILLIIAIVVLGVISLLRLTGRGVRRAADTAAHRRR